MTISTRHEVLENIFTQWEYKYRRCNERVYTVLSGHCGDYTQVFSWNRSARILHCYCDMSAKFDKRKIKAVTDLVFMMNSRLWLGRFDLLLKERAVVFSISNIIQEELACSEVIERMVDTTVVECDRFLPAFNMLIGTKISPRQVFDSCIMDVEGEA